jgi:hypothetical protein
MPPETRSSRYREDAGRADRLAALAANDTLRQDLLDIAAEFRAESAVWHRIECKLALIKASQEKKRVERWRFR